MAISCADVSIQPLPATGQETGIDMGLESFAMRANGQHICTPATTAGTKTLCGAALGGSRGASKGAIAEQRR